MDSASESVVLLSNVRGADEPARYYLVALSEMTTEIRRMLKQSIDGGPEAPKWLAALGEPLGGLDRHGFGTKARKIPAGARVGEIVEVFTDF